MKTPTLLILLSTLCGYAQSDYAKYRQGLEGVGCGEVSAEKYHATIPKIESWISAHPQQHRPYYDLAMCYYSLCVSDSAQRAQYSGLAIAANEKYIARAPLKEKYRGYLNNAFIRGWLKNCEGAIDDLEKAKAVFRQRPKHWDTESENAIRKKCAGTAHLIN